jgi:flagellin
MPITSITSAEPSIITAFNKATSDANKATQRISTGLRVNSAADDPTGIAKASVLSAQISSFATAQSNIVEGVALLQNVDTSLGSIGSILTNMRTLAVSAAGETDSTTRAAYQSSFDSYVADISSIVSRTQWKGTSVLDGTTSQVSIQTGIYANQTKTIDLPTVSSANLGIDSVDLSTSTATASAAIASLDSAISINSGQRTQIGSYLNSMSINTSWNESTKTNLTKAYTSIMSADQAAETANLAAAQIKQTGSSAMLAQANQMNKDLVKYLLRLS